MDLNLISLFVEIVESRSLGGAARKLRMTRANISQRLKLLERETDVADSSRSSRLRRYGGRNAHPVQGDGLYRERAENRATVSGKQIEPRQCQA
jgi:hypothetical protein